MRTLFLVAVLLLVGIISCTPVSEPKNDKVTPPALDDKEISIKSYRGGSDLVDELYKGLVENSKELQEIEKEYESFDELQQKPFHDFGAFNDKSVSWYNSAKAKLNGLSDSLLKSKFIITIENSSTRYEKNLEPITALRDRILKNRVVISDVHTILKIMLTLPLIEKFQSDHYPTKADFLEVLKTQEKFIEKMQSKLNAE